MTLHAVHLRGGGTRSPLLTFRVKLEVRDTDVPAWGPHGRDCGDPYLFGHDYMYPHAVQHDAVAFDQSFTCAYSSETRVTSTVVTKVLWTLVSLLALSLMAFSALFAYGEMEGTAAVLLQSHAGSAPA